MHWTTRYGDQIAIADMDDFHLDNAISCTERWAERHAQRCQLDRRDVLARHELYGELLLERDRRRPTTQTEKLTAAAFIAALLVLAYKTMAPN